MFEQCSVQETVSRWESDERKGLTEEEARRRLAENGRNEMKAAEPKTAPEAFVEQLNDPLIYVLLAAAVVSVLLKEISDGAIIAAVVCVNAFVGMVQEGKARKALESLKKLTSPRARVIRDGIRREIPAAELVTGDLVCLEAGAQVPADLRLIRTNNLKVEESALTGESLPMEKDASFRADEGKGIPLGDRRNMAYMSTLVTYGRGEGIVTATGMDTEIGQIAAMITESKEDLTPLQKRLGELGKLLSILSLFLCAALLALAVVQHRNIPQMLITAISLAVAAVPEGLPAVVTICLALSVTRMVRVNTIVRRLPSVETLGAVSVVCSDKTGTLTRNCMTVERLFVGNGFLEGESAERAAAGAYGRAGSLSDNGSEDSIREFFQGMVLCNDAALSDNGRLGDPTELALLDAAEKNGFKKSVLERQFPRCSELPFDSDRKMMTTCHKTPAGYISYTKGAPDEVLKKCTQIRLGAETVPLTEDRKRAVLRAVEEMSFGALRTLAAASKRLKYPGDIKEANLTFLGLAGMKDPIRPEAAEAVHTFAEAGVTTVMITGDHVDTAFAIGKQLGIVNRMEQCMTGERMQGLEEAFLKELENIRVFARVSPAQKVRIVKGFKSLGRIVAMTGDGVNDAPSLKSADIGIAMGMTGTDVAKQAADMILADDNFATIEKAIEEGRGVYENIRKSVIFLLSSNLGELATMFLAVLCGMASPLKSSHILWINLITDSLPALALGVDKNDGKGLMKHPPRRAKESLFSRGGLACTCFYGILIAALSLTAFFLFPVTLLRGKGMPVTLDNLTVLLEEGRILAKSQTYAFTVLGMSQLFHAVGMRDTEKSVFGMKHWENRLMVFACIIGFALQFAVTEIPLFIQAFGTSPLTGREWLVLSILAAGPLFSHELNVLLGKMFH